MKDKTDSELKSIIEKAVAELYNRGYNVETRGTLGSPRRKPTIECTKVVKL
jgi:hypothetical protein